MVSRTMQLLFSWSFQQNGWDDALAQCEKVLEIEPTNKKALFRRGQARFGIKDYNLAIKDLTEVNKLEPNDRAVASELIKVKKAKQMSVEKEKNMYGKMFK